MSTKINITSIIRNHFDTLIDDRTGNRSLIDYCTFLILPIAVAVCFSVFDIQMSNYFRSGVITFGAIFAALLMSVLVLVYDQIKNNSKEILKERVMKASKEIEQTSFTLMGEVDLEARDKLLKQINSNICFTLLTAVLAVLLTLIQIIAAEHSLSSFNRYLLTPVIVFLTINMFLITIMIVKRMYLLLESEIVIPKI